MKFVRNKTKGQNKDPIQLEREERETERDRGGGRGRHGGVAALCWPTDLNFNGGMIAMETVWKKKESRRKKKKKKKKKKRDGKPE